MEQISKKYVNVYTEASPNPGSLKFVVNYMLTPEGLSFDFPNRASASSSPLAMSLFDLESVERVFVMNNFITITKKDTVEWEDIARSLKLYIQEYLEQDKPIFSKELLHSESSLAESANDTDIVKKIKSILEEYIRPAVESDGGAITFHSFDESNGRVTVILQGSCSGCPSSTVTLKAGIENLLKRMLPEVEEVVAENM